MVTAALTAYQATSKIKCETIKIGYWMNDILLVTVKKIKVSWIIIYDYGYEYF